MKKCKGKYGPHFYDDSKSRCPECNSMWFKESRLKNPERYRKNRMSSYYKNHEVNKSKMREYGNNNKENKRLYDKKYREDNNSIIKEKKRLYYIENKEKVREGIKKHYSDNKHMYTGYTAKRRFNKRNATPKWSELDKIALLYEKCKWLQELTGMEYDVDHIIPLNNIDVCGLHCWANLQILEKSLNRKKSNKLNIILSDDQ